MSAKKANLQSRREARHDELTAVVKGIVHREKAAQDAKTEKLRKLRAARDEADAAVKKKPAKRGKR